MKLTPDCVPCLMKRILFQAKLLDNGCEKEAVRAALRVYADNIDYGCNSAELATKVHKAAYAAMKADPYEDLKKRADEVAAGYLEFAEKYVGESKDRFSAAIKIAAIGNIMDFGLGLAIDDPEQFKDKIEDMLNQGIGSDDTEKFRALLKKSKKILYFFDNCGESQFDKILIKEIQSMGVKVIGVVRGEKILNDVTLEEAKRIGLDKILDGLITTGEFRIGCDLSNPGVKKELDSADLIVCKGMANYESMGDQPTVAKKVFILRTKCIPVANSLGVKPDINVVRVQ